MAQATTIPFSGFKVLLETTPGVYAAPCGLIERSLTLTKETNDSLGIDCADEDAPQWVERDVLSYSAQLSGNGLVARESLKFWRDAFDSGAAKNTRIHVSGTVGEGGGDWVGRFILTSLEIGTARNQRVSINIEMLSDGVVQWIPLGSVPSAGTAAGTSTALGAGGLIAILSGVGSAAGVGTPTGVGASLGTASGAGSSVGSSTVNGVSPAAGTTGTAIGMLLVLTKA